MLNETFSVIFKHREKDISDHRQWNNGNQNRHNFNAFNRLKLQSASPSNVQQVARRQTNWYYCQHHPPQQSRYSQWWRYCQVQPREPKASPSSAAKATKPQVFQRTWRRGSPHGNQEYTFRHTIIQRVKKPEKRGFVPYMQYSWIQYSNSKVGRLCICQLWKFEWNRRGTESKKREKWEKKEK